MPINRSLDLEVIDLDDAPDDQLDQAADLQPATPGSLADELAQAQARADRLRAEVTAQQQAEARKQQERADEYDRRIVAAYDPVARRAERDALRGKLRAAVEAGDLGLTEYADLRVHDALTAEIGREVENAAGRLGLPVPAGIERIPPWRPANDLALVLGQIAGEVEADRLEEARRAHRQRREDHIAGRGEVA